MHTTCHVFIYNFGRRVCFWSCFNPAVIVVQWPKTAAMPFSKSCPSCGGEVHVRKLVCQFCGCVLRSSKPLVNTIKLKTRSAASQVLKRALETEKETAKRGKLNKERAIIGAEPLKHQTKPMNVESSFCLSTTCTSIKFDYSNNLPTNMYLVCGYYCNWHW